jgi:hypothetical protein
MLPSGALPNQLLEMWGPSHEKCSEILGTFGLLEFGVERRRLTPFMMNYAEETIDKESKENFNMKIAECYEEILRTFYNSSIEQR